MDGEIQYTEFLAVTLDKEQRENNLKMVFQIIDRKNKGYLTMKDFQKSFKIAGKAKHATEIR